jgi:hypothetical protein
MSSQRDEVFEQWCRRTWQTHPRAKRHGYDLLDRREGPAQQSEEFWIASRMVDALCSDNPHLLDYDFQRPDEVDPWADTLDDFPHLRTLLRGDRGSAEALMIYAGLPAAEVEACRMWFEGVSVQGIARALRRTDGTVRVLLQRSQYRLSELPRLERESAERQRLA